MKESIDEDNKQNNIKDKGYELSPYNPGWIKKEKYIDEDIVKIFVFYVINTPCVDLSSSSIPTNDYGWKKDVWSNKKGELKDILFNVAKLEHNKTLFVAKKRNEMKDTFEKASLKKNFHKKRDIEKVAIYKGKYPEFLSICYHIRNSIAHGRFTIYDNKDKEKIFVFEDGIKNNGDFEVRSRMILKKSTLLKWIELIQLGMIKK